MYIYLFYISAYCTNCCGVSTDACLAYYAQSKMRLYKYFMLFECYICTALVYIENMNKEATEWYRFNMHSLVYTVHAYAQSDVRIERVILLHTIEYMKMLSACRLHFAIVRVYEVANSNYGFSDYTFLLKHIMYAESDTLCPQKNFDRTRTLSTCLCGDLSKTPSSRIHQALIPP